MKLNEKILYCRKRAGLSQEALAERIGVSRQAVSKWETADAEPELSKLRLLSAEFGVSADWLLSEEEPGEETYTYNEQPKTERPDRMESLPGVIGRLARRFGWLAGWRVCVRPRHGRAHIRHHSPSDSDPAHAGPVRPLDRLQQL